MSYISDFLVRMKRRSNIPVAIYLLINTYVIGEICAMCLQMPFWKAYLIGLVLYAISLTLALSPFGEWLLRWQLGCNEIKRKEYVNRLEPIFYDVYKKAKKQDPTLPDDVKLYMNMDNDANAFATGRKTVCVTKGLLSLNDDQIKGTLAHEFGHLAHKDTDLLLFVVVGNFIVTTIVNIINAFLFIMSLFRHDFMNAVVLFLRLVVINALMWVWTKLGMILVNKAGRNNEYEADEFAFELGLGNDLCYALDTIAPSTGRKGLFAHLASTHPETDDRIARLQSLGCTYMSGNGNS